MYPRARSDSVRSASTIAPPPTPRRRRRASRTRAKRAAAECPQSPRRRGSRAAISARGCVTIEASMTDTRTGALLLNLGTPDSPSVRDVRRYLREFLSDPRVIDIPAVARWLLLNLVILPFRPAKSAAAYAKVWMPAGSPLLVHSRALEQAVAEADRLLNTFNALLRIARIESQHGEESFTAIALGDLVRDVAELYEPLMEEKSQTLEMQLNGEVTLSGDRDLLFQAIANLLDNATKYTPAGGGIRIELARLNGKGRLVIADSGPGIPEAAREKVFQRFFRLEQSRTTPGNGLGMSLVAAVVTLHRMSIRLEDNRPGLRVVIDFPLCDSAAAGNSIN